MHRLKHLTHDFFKGTKKTHRRAGTQREVCKVQGSSSGQEGDVSVMTTTHALFFVFFLYFTLFLFVRPKMLTAQTPSCPVPGAAPRLVSSFNTQVSTKIHNKHFLSFFLSLFLSFCLSFFVSAPEAFEASLLSCVVR